MRKTPRLARQSSETSGSLLTKVIEREIIPRLLLAHPALRDARLAEDVGDEIISVEAFAHFVLASDSEGVVAHVEMLMNRGVNLETVFLALLAPVARKLGQMWLEDRCTFAEVTLGLSRLHRVLHEIGRRGIAAPQRAIPYRAFFAPVPGEQHTFGVSMIEELFRRAGWETSCEYDPSAAGIAQVAAGMRLDVIGFSIGSYELLEPLSRLIDNTRAASRNPDITIMVGGGLFIDNRDLADRFGNTTIVADGVNAVRIAEDMVRHVRDRAGIEKLV